MELRQVEQQRTGLQQSLILMIMVLVTLIMFVIHGPVEGVFWIDVLAVACLLVCLYVLTRERQLKRIEADLIDQVRTMDREVGQLGRKLSEEQFELVEEKERAADLQSRLTEIATLYRAINKVNGEPDDHRVVGTVLRAALDLVGGDRGSIMLLDQDKQYLHIASAVGIEDSIARTTRQRVGQGVAGWVAKFGEPTRISGSAEDDDRFSNVSESSGNVEAALCVPLKLRGDTVGVMNLGRSGPGGEDFSDYHMRLAAIFGEHASVAIMYSRLRRLLGDAGLMR